MIFLCTKKLSSTKSIVLSLHKFNHISLVPKIDRHQVDGEMFMNFRASIDSLGKKVKVVQRFRSLDGQRIIPRWCCQILIDRKKQMLWRTGGILGIWRCSFQATCRRNTFVRVRRQLFRFDSVRIPTVHAGGWFAGCGIPFTLWWSFVVMKQ